MNKNLSIRRVFLLFCFTLVFVSFLGSATATPMDTNYVIVDRHHKIFATEPTYTGTITSYTRRGNEDFSVGYFVNDGIMIGDWSLLADDGIVSSLNLKMIVHDDISDYTDDPADYILNPVIAMGAGTDLTLTGSIIAFDDSDGAIASDFSGRGAMITAANYAKVLVDHMNIYTDGFVRAAFIADQYGQILVKNSTVTAMGANPLTEAYEGYVNSANQSIMISPPWVLGIQGGARLANMLGKNSTLSVIGSKVSAGGWGVLSTDAGNNFMMNVVDSKVEILPESKGGMSSGNFPYSKKYGSGYGTYIIGSATEKFYGATFHGTTYASILTGGNAYYMSSRGDIALSDAEGAEIETIQGKGNVTSIYSVFGFMAHNSGSINVLDGTVVKTEEATFLYKAGNVNFVADNAILMPGSRIILQMIDNDDSTVGASMGAGGPVFNTEFFEDEGWPSENGNVTGSNARNNTVTLSLTNGKYKGNVFNGTGYYTQKGDVLEVTIGPEASLKGQISLTETRHIDENGDQNTYFTINEYYYLGHVENRNYRNGYSSVSVSLTDGGVWEVTGESLISSLYLDGGIIKAVKGYEVVMTVDGVETDIEQNITYSGDIVISLVRDWGKPCDDWFPFPRKHDHFKLR